VTNKERFDDIDRQITGIRQDLGPIQERLGLPTTIKRPSWLQRNLPTILPILATVIVVPLSIFVFNLTVDHRIDAKISPVNKSLGELDQKGTAIGARLDTLEPFIHDLVQLQLRRIAALPQTELQGSLAEVQRFVSAARNQQIMVDSATMDGLSKKLAAVPDKNNPAFWQTAALVISYRSSSLVGSLKNWTAQFPPCPGTVDLDASPNASVQGQSPEGKLLGPIPIQRVGNQDCYVQLDGKSVSRWDCTRCLVKYSGGPLKMRDVNFKDCLFVFDFQAKQPPTPDGQTFSETLLASGLSNISIPAS
jgi:hypothetical protein